MTAFTIYIIGVLFVFYYETEDILLGNLSTTFQQIIAFSLFWPISIPFGAYSMWKEIIKNRKDPECSECHNKSSVGHKMSCGERYYKGE